MDSMVPDDVSFFSWDLSSERMLMNVNVISIFSVYLVLVPIVLKETRSSVLLTRLAKKKRKETGSNRYRARIEDERPPLWTLIYMSCTRPIRMSGCRTPISMLERTDCVRGGFWCSFDAYGAGCAGPQCTRINKLAIVLI
jgi:hypothetical protein